MSGNRRRTFVLAIGFVTVAVSAPWARAQTRAAATATTADLSSTVEATARLVGPSVVQIFTTSYAPGEGLVARTADLVTTQRASGSGVIVDPAGYIVTNAHVVRGSLRLRVELPIATAGRSILATGSRSVGAEVVGIDLETDLAVIKVDEQRLTALAFADSDDLKAGQVVLAIGSPLGFSNSVSLGVVSAVARQLAPESPMIYVQTDASINHGSSGGPLVDMRGRLVGINTLIVSQTDNYQGFGFAAPSNIVRAVYEQIRKSGRVRRGEIGVRAQTVTPVMAAGLHLARDHGAVLADVVPGSPAAQSGLRPGDLVLALDGKPIENGRQFHVGLYRRVAGDIVNVDVLRDGKTVTLPIAMSERNDPLGGVSASVDPRQNLVPRLGILGVAMTPQLAQLLRAQRVPSGVLVASTVAGATDSRDGGLAAGDIVYAINGTPIAGLAELRAALDVLKMGDAVVLQLERRGELMYLAFTVD